MDSFVTILTFTHPIDAAVIRSKLESEDVECFLKNEYSISTNPFYSNALGGVELQVRTSDLEKAKEIIEASHSGYLVEKETEGADGRMICPVCGADQADRVHYKAFLFFLFLFYLVPLFLFGRKRNCYKCGYVFPNGKTGLN